MRRSEAEYDGGGGFVGDGESDGMWNESEAEMGLTPLSGLAWVRSTERKSRRGWVRRLW